MDPTPIKITLLPINCENDEEAGQVVDGVAGQTTSLDLLKAHYPCDGCLVDLNDKELWDHTRPLVKDCRVSLLYFQHPKGNEVFWHSSAHVIGAAIEIILGVEITVGHAQENGFFYDVFPVERKIDADALKEIENKCKEIVKSKASNERKAVTREEAMTVFPQNHYKQEIFRESVEPGSLVTLYRTGTFIDLCRGPHLVGVSAIEKWWVCDVSASNFAGREDYPVTRIRAITFPQKKLMNDYKHS